VKKLLFAAFLVLVFANAKEQSEELNNVVTLTGGDIQDLAVRDINEIYIPTVGAGINKTTNGGITIRGINPPSSPIFDRNFTSVYVDGTNIYAGGGAPYFGNSPGFLVSSDDGNTFNTIGLEGEHISDIVGTGNLGEVYLSVKSSGVYHFENNTLTQFNNGLGSTNINALHYDTEDGEPFFAGAEEGLWEYDFSVQSWVSSSLSDPIKAFTKGENNTTYIASKSQIYETTDNTNFNPITDLNPGGDFTYTSIDYDSPYLYAAISPDNNEHNIPLVNRYNTNTSTWESDIVGLPANYGIPRVVKIGFDYKYLGTTNGFYSGEITGSWQNPTEEFSGGQITEVNYNNYNGYYYAGGFLGDLRVTMDINQNWTNNDEGLKLFNLVRDIEHTSAGTIVVQSSAVNFQQNVFDPYERREMGLNSVFYTHAAHNPNNNVTVLGSFDKIYYSTNLGIEWQVTNHLDFADKLEFSESQEKFYGLTFNDMFVGDANGQVFNTFVPNIFAIDFAIKDDPNDFKLGVSANDSFFEYDENANGTELGRAGLENDEFIEKVAYSPSINTWLVKTENNVYSFNNTMNQWDKNAEVNHFILSLSVNFGGNHPLKSIGEDEIFVGTFGGGLFSNAASTSIEKTDDEVLSDYFLSQNYPNPFNPSTTIQFSLPQTSHVTLEVFNTLGERVGVLASEELTAGTYNYSWDAAGLTSGIYFYKLQAGSFVETKKMILMK